MTSIEEDSLRIRALRWTFLDEFNEDLQQDTRHGDSDLMRLCCIATSISMISNRVTKPLRIRELVQSLISKEAAVYVQ